MSHGSGLHRRYLITVDTTEPENSIDELHILTGDGDLSDGIPEGDEIHRTGAEDIHLMYKVPSQNLQVTFHDFGTSFSS